MATADEYAQWIVKNAAKKGTPEFETVAKAYQLAKQEPASAPAATQEVPGPRVPKWGQENPTLYGIAGAARETLGPIIQAGAGILGGLAGAPGGIPGSVGGAALGYGMGSQALRAADIALGNVQPGNFSQEAAKAVEDVGTGATMEMGGRVAGDLVGRVAAPVGRFIRGSKELSKTKAAEVARKAAGTELPAIVNALREAPEGMTAAQAAAPVWSPTTQAALGRAAQYAPNKLMGSGAPGVTEAQNVAATNTLAEMAGGATQTATRASREAAKADLNATLGPVRDAALERANLGKVIPEQETRAAELLKSAKQVFNEVTQAQPGIQLGQVAPETAKASAMEAGLIVERARLAKSIAESLRADGIAPIMGGDLASRIVSLGERAGYAGNDLPPALLKKVAEDIMKHTNKSGALDVIALDSIRKNSVNSILDSMGLDPKLKQKVAAGVLAKVKPLIDDAIEAAGGVGYKKYLEDYSKGMQEIAKQRLTSEALKLYKDSPAQFVKLVQGETPDVVEKILGAGNYNIGVELAQDAVSKLKGIADVTQRGMRAAEQSSMGQASYRELLTGTLPRIKLPWGLSPSGAAINKGLDVLERKLGAKVMREIADASVDAKSYEELLTRMPKSSASKFKQVIEGDRALWQSIGGKTSQTINALSNESSRNSLAPD